MSTLLDDLRWALRYALRRPVFSLTVTITLSITIAASTSAFGLAAAVLWRPLPFSDASRLVFVWEEVEQRTSENVELSGVFLLFMVLAALIADGGYDVVHAHGLRAALLALDAAGDVDVLATKR